MAVIDLPVDSIQQTMSLVEKEKGLVLQVELKTIKAEEDKKDGKTHS